MTDLRLAFLRRMPSSKKGMAAQAAAVRSGQSTSNKLSCRHLITQSTTNTLYPLGHKEATFTPSRQQPNSCSSSSSSHIPIPAPSESVGRSVGRPVNQSVGTVWMELDGRAWTGLRVLPSLSRTRLPCTAPFTACLTLSRTVASHPSPFLSADDSFSFSSSSSSNSSSLCLPSLPTSFPCATVSYRHPTNSVFSTSIRNPLEADCQNSRTAFTGARGEKSELDSEPGDDDDDDDDDCETPSSMHDYMTDWAARSLAWRRRARCDAMRRDAFSPASSSPFLADPTILHREMFSFRIAAFGCLKHVTIAIVFCIASRSRNLPYPSLPYPRPPCQHLFLRS
ncbi:hypothetical protein IWX48DRAFT_587685 [Phyllosticta citricarpa]